MRKGTCSVVEDNECRAPAAIQAGGGGIGECDPGPVGTCESCGDDVCTAPLCSRRVWRYGRRVRWCSRCLAELAALDASKGKT